MFLFLLLYGLIGLEVHRQGKKIRRTSREIHQLEADARQYKQAVAQLRKDIADFQSVPEPQEAPPTEVVLYLEP